MFKQSCHNSSANAPRASKEFVLDLEAYMNAKIKSEMISRRRALSLLELPVALGVAASIVLMSSDAEAETAGMQNRQQRRTNRQENRQQRRTGQ
jgi:hypothetical protein